ncbi:type III secretion inner membrane ring lipoprotein SctJ [Rhizobacter sp. SG703]|uniref:type III secretion system inner membrane ring lipoprotein SctJ n=1 Tax=Rhizobacter sp. SG703 TaxID=2587140 RepID=UPI0018469EF0|nr:type III secretion inner membrane ring lipoprotein SctJ [Rhizobacter sp. SG703]NKI94055.1 type III secretion protein J [Rhizobacter sp. SG703]
MSTQHTLRLTLPLVLALLSGCSRPADLLTDVSESEANEVVAALSQARIEASKRPAKEGLVNVEIDAAQVPAAVVVLQNEGLPRERHASMGEVFRKEGLISSPLEERARYLWALSQELGTTLSQMDGVLKARVHVVLPERGNGSEPPLPSSAAVFIKHQRGYNLQASVPQIKMLVSGSIPGLQVDRVAVVLVSAQKAGAVAESAAGSVPKGAETKSAETKGAEKAAEVASAASGGQGAVINAKAASAGAGRPRWTMVAAIAGLALLGIAGGAVVWWLKRRRKPAAAPDAAPGATPGVASTVTPEKQA